jgi:hypothetical protein
MKLNSTALGVASNGVTFKPSFMKIGHIVKVEKKYTDSMAISFFP